MIERINKIRHVYMTRLSDYIIKHQVMDYMRDPEERVNECFDTFIDADPTENKKYLRWLLEVFLNDGFLFEDIEMRQASKVYETLSVFHKQRHNLPVEQRSLNKYNSLGQMWASVSPFILNKSHREEKSEERQKAWDESEIITHENRDMILDDNTRISGQFIILSPKTEYASKWFGKGTRWCTSAENNNLFSQYNEKAPLYIFVLPDGQKFQLWVHDERNDIQFMDSNDNRVQKDTVLEYWEYFKQIIKDKKALDLYPDYEIELVFKDKHDILNDDELKSIVARSEESIVFYNLYKDYIQDPVYHQYMRYLYKNQFRHHKQFDLTEEEIDTSIKMSLDYNADIFSMIPTSLLKREYIDYVLDRNKGMTYNKEFYGRPFKSMEIVYTGEDIIPSLKMDDGSFLYLTPEDVYKMCLWNHNHLKYYDQSLFSDEQLKSLLKENVLTYIHMDKDRVDDETLKSILKDNGFLLHVVPKEKWTREILDIAFETDGFAVLTPEDIEAYNIDKTKIGQYYTNIAMSSPHFTSMKLDKKYLTKEHMVVYYKHHPKRLTRGFLNESADEPDLLDADTYFEIIKENNLYNIDIPNNMSEEKKRLCMEHGNTHAFLHFFKKGEVDTDTIMRYLTKSPNIIMFLSSWNPDIVVTDEMISTALNSIKLSRHSVIYIELARTKEHYTILAEKNPNLIKFFPEGIIGDFIDKIPEQYEWFQSKTHNYPKKVIREHILKKLSNTLDIEDKKHLTC